MIRDGVGHDLDETHPTYRYDMDGIATAPDGTVWLMTSYSDADSDANPGGGGPLVWALGQPGSFGIGQGVPRWGHLVVQADGTPLVIADYVVRFDGERFVPDDGPMYVP